MEDREKLALLLKVARWYYIDDLSQDEIAARLGQSRSSVSRLLKQARERRVVRFQVGHPLERAMALEKALVDRYDIQEARVCIPNLDQSSLDVVAEGAAEVMVDRTQDATVVSVSNGTTVSAVIARMPKVNRPDCCVVQMIGVLGKANRLADSPEVTRRLAETLDCDYRLMPAPPRRHRFTAGRRAAPRVTGGHGPRPRRAC